MVHETKVKLWLIYSHGAFHYAKKFSYEIASNASTRIKY